MKTILVDAINCFVLKESATIFSQMHKLLEQYPHKKIVLTGANDEQIKQYNLHLVPYTLFTLKHNPEKSDPSYYTTLLKTYNLQPQDVIYFEHNESAVKSAQSVGILTYHYDKDKRDLTTLKTFLDKQLKQTSQ